MRHVENALEKMQGQPLARFISIENAADIEGVPPTVKFTLQSDPISVVGINGCQHVEILEFCLHLISSLDQVHPCDENQLTIESINEAIYYQKQRTADRTDRGVEGKFKD